VQELLKDLKMIIKISMINYIIRKKRFRKK